MGASLVMVYVRLREGWSLHGPDPCMDAWALQILGAGVTAHVRAGRLGLAVAGLAGGDPSAVRLLALAERLGVLREFGPTMSVGRARRMAENADGAAYADVVSEYAALGRDELRAAARAVVAVTWGRG
ncbi:hypothetical protein [Micromonospora inositola]|uniref:Uncharacterized protein n=1 Tax=Micromonospora inositola TaxID=47865 RepID=A0A1C5HK08_9ACTN|nr:hypothetical protein [Micromonospora inositola]SCG46308.1 hypothetical protein GA0070613_1439 [Micromonospora inositola]